VFFVIPTIKISGKASIDNELAKFRYKEYPYNEVVPSDGDPILYWKNLAGTIEGEELAKLALQILQFPQSSASIERSFSAVRRIHTWQRSSLGREKLAKMVYVYFNSATLRKRKNNKLYNSCNGSVNKAAAAIFAA